MKKHIIELDSISKYLLVITIFTSIIHTSIATDCLPNASNYIICNDFNYNASENIDMRIRVLNQKFTNFKVFYVQHHATPRYERNTQCWASDFNLTCISPWNSTGENRRAGTLITPRHVILANHYNIKRNDSIRFITKDNQIIQRKVIGGGVVDQNLYPDIHIVTLDSVVPPSIKPCKFLPGNYADYISNNGKGLPVLCLDQEEKALVADINYISNPNNFSLSVPTNQDRLNFNESIITGDSGNPVFLILNGELVLLGVFTWGGAGSGTSLTKYANLPDNGVFPDINLNDIIKLADKSAGIPATNYKISFFNFEENPSAVGQIKELSKISTRGNGVEIKLESLNSARIEVFDISGQKIIYVEQVSLMAFYPLKKGLYFIRLRARNMVETKKVYVK